MFSECPGGNRTTQIMGCVNKFIFLLSFCIMMMECLKTENNSFKIHDSHEENIPDFETTVLTILSIFNGQNT